MVDNEYKSLRTQGVVQGDCYHGVGVTGQLTDDPLRVRQHLQYVVQTKKNTNPVIPLATLTSGLFCAKMPIKVSGFGFKPL